MKTLILGDIHGKTIWKDIVRKENPDLTIFLGDYVTTHEGISSDQQVSNLEEILNYKESNLEKVILLRGNHDCQCLGYYWAECSGRERAVEEYMTQPDVMERFLKLTQWIYIEGKVIYSHAGVSKVWLENNNLTLDKINEEEPSEIFGFTPDNYYDYSGESETQPCTWIRPTTLLDCALEGFTQVIGHTPVSEGIIHVRDLWLCDALGVGQYLIRVDETFIVGKTL